MRHRLKNFVKEMKPLYRFLQKLVYRRKICRKIPDGLSIELTNRCNLRCRYCPKSKGYNSGLTGDMEFDLFKNIIDEACAALNLKQICLTGLGESLMYSNLLEAIEYVKNKSLKIRVAVTTNGILLNEQMSKKLISSGLDSLSISINFVSREKYKTMNGSDFYDLVVKNAKFFLDLIKNEHKNNRPKVYIQTLDTLNTEEEVEKFRNYWKPYLTQDSVVQIQPFVNWRGIISDIGDANKCKERYPCGHLCGCVINKDGGVLACCMALPLFQNDKSLFLGNLKKGSILSCINSKKMNRLRKLNVEGDLKQIPICMDCDAWETSYNVWFRNKYLKWLVGRKWI